MKSDTTEIEITEHMVVLRRKGISRPIVANVLGMDRDSVGSPKRVFLDRLVHSPNEDVLGDWKVSGAISSILEAP